MVQEENTRRHATDDAQDQYLIQKIIERDRSAFESFFLTYRPRIFRFLSPLLKREDAIEEVCHDTLMVVWRHADRFRAESRVSTWVFGIAYRTAIKALQKIEKHSADQFDENLHDTAVNIEFLKRQDYSFSDWLVQGLSRLSPEQQAIIQLTYYHDYSYHEIAEILDCPLNTVKTRMHYARKKLKDVLPKLASSPL